MAKLLSILRQNSFLSRRDLGRMVYLPPQSVERLECGNYPLHRIGRDGQAVLEAGLREALNTDLSLPEMLAEI